MRIQYLLRHITRTGDKVQRLTRKRELHGILTEEHLLKVLGSPEVVVRGQAEHACLLIASTLPAPWGVSSASLAQFLLERAQQMKTSTNQDENFTHRLCGKIPLFFH